MDALVLLRRVNKLITGGNVETKCDAETEGKAMQRLSHLGIQPKYSHQTQTLLSTKPRCYCGYREVFVAGSLVWLSPEGLCQSLTNTEVKDLSQELD